MPAVVAHWSAFGYLSRVDIFGALADPVRRALLVAVVDGPTRVVDLAARHDVTRPAISRHLKVLSEAGLLTAADCGRERHYALAPDAPAALAEVRELLDTLAGAPAGRLSANALDALDTEVRRTSREWRTRRGRAARPSREESA
jgi:DNA-binding transcriptional ArsR family regulator